MKCIAHMSITGEVLYYCKKTLATCKEVQFVQTQHHSAKWHKRATDGHTVKYRVRTYHKSSHIKKAVTLAILNKGSRPYWHDFIEVCYSITYCECNRH